MTRFPVVTSFVLAVLVTSSRSQTDSPYECPRGSLWSLLEISGIDQPAEVLCYSVASPRRYEDALQYCHRQQARLLSPVTPFASYRIPSSTTFLDVLWKNGVTNFWYGYHVRSGRLRKDTFPMTQLRDSNFQNTVSRTIPWFINTSFPTHSEPQGISTCFEMTLNLNITCPPAIEETDAPTGAGSQSLCENGRTSVKSRNCRETLPFVCVKPALQKQSITFRQLNTLCQPDEFGHVNFPRCFSFGQENVNHSIAQTRCEAKDRSGKKPRTLYGPVSDAFSSSSTFDGRVVNAITASLNQTQKQTTWQNSFAWVGRKEEVPGGCLALSLDNYDVISWDCSALLPFYICQSAVTMPEVGQLNMEVSIPEVNVPFTVSNISGTNDRQVSFPSNVTAPKAFDVPYLTCVYTALRVPDLQTMTLVKRGIPLAQFPTPTTLIIGNALTTLARQAEGPVSIRSTSVSVELKNGVAGSSARNVTDYYWCEINDLKSGRVFQSGRVFVRTKGIEMYAVSIAMNSTVGVRVSRPQLIEQSYIGTEDTGRLSTDLSFGDFDYRVLRYRPELNPSGSNRTIVDFHLFNKTETRKETKVTSGRLREVQGFIKSRVENFGQSEVSFIYNFDPESVQVRSIDICPFTSVSDPVSQKAYKIPDTNLGEVYTSPDICLSNGEPYVRLVCEGDKLFGAKWSEFKPTPGCQYNNADTSPITTKLKNISESDINEGSLDQVVKNTTEAVTAIDTFAAVDLVYLADILQQSTNLDTVSKQNGKKILELVDTVVNINKTVLEQSNNLGNATNRILRAIDNLGDKIALDNGVNNVRVVADTTGMEVWDLNRVTGDVIVGLELRLDGGEPMPVMKSDDLVSLFDSVLPSYSETDAAILLPGAFIREMQKKNAGREVRLAMNVFANTALFSLGRLESSPLTFSSNATLNSKVIAAKVTVDGVPVFSLEGYNITSVYLPVQKLPPDSHAGNSTCVFWDFAGAKGQGSWSPEGCRYNRTLLGRDVCVCDHLTNFAVLLDFYGQSALPQDQQLALSVITIVGLSLSIAGLSCTVLSFLLIKKLRQGKPQQILFNMALAMLASWIVFLAGFSRVENYTGCVTVAVLLHYFILASFMWMLMEGVLQYMLFVKVLGNDFDNYLLKTAIPAWGIPLIPVIVVLAIDTDMYHGGDKYCWMALTPFYYSFLAPVGLIMLANIVVYIMVVVNICRRGNIGSSSSNKRTVGIRASVACFVALGLSWVFAFFAIDDARVVFQYLFTITASLQGFLIFLIFTARDPNVRAFWKQTCCRGRMTTSDKTSSSMDPLRQGRHGPRDGRSGDMPLSSSEQSGSNGSQGVVNQRTTGSQLSSASSVPGYGYENYTYSRE